MEDSAKEPAVRRVFKQLGLEVKPGDELPVMLECVATNLLYIHGMGELLVQLVSDVSRLRKDVDQQRIEIEKVGEAIQGREAAANIKPHQH